MQLQLPYYSYLEKYPSKGTALYQALRDAIVGGKLPYGERLPSTREMAQLYGLSRGTVNQAYETLAAEGYLKSEVGRGTFVAFAERGRSGDYSAFGAQSAGGVNAIGEKGFRLSAWGEAVAALPGRAEIRLPAGGIDFGGFRADAASFPREAWSRCLHAQVRELSGAAEPGGDAEPLGSRALRGAIAQHVRRARGIDARAEHVAVTGGSMQALALLAQLLLGPGETAVAETPAFIGFRRAIGACGARCIDAEVDAQGIVPADWDARALFVTPARQFPTGAVLPLERRQALLRWADERDAVIVEDDYDSEFRHRGKSLEPLKALDRGERVVYVGSFSKTMPPAARIGYAVLPPSLAQPFARAMGLMAGPHPVNLLEQRALAAFMASGEYERHLRRMKRVYGRKFALLTQLLQAELGGLFRWVEGDAGLHVFGWWRGDEASYFSFRERCRRLGVGWSEASAPLPGHTDPAAAEAGHTDPAAAEAGHIDPAAARAGHIDPAAARAGHTDPAVARAGHIDPSAAVAGHTDPSAARAGHTDLAAAEAGHTDLAAAEAGHTDPAVAEAGHTDPAAARAGREGSRSAAGGRFDMHGGLRWGASFHFPHLSEADMELGVALMKQAAAEL
jgi:GntR family transcriptional regulator/MocR family aminotransferase